MKLAEIGTNRLKDVLVTDKKHDPKKLTYILKNDMQSIAEDYLELKNDIDIKVENEDDELTFIVEIKAKRIKDYGVCLNE